jgi:hypothetical protein
MVVNHLPRGGEYEIFTVQGRTSCFDDTTLENPAIVDAPVEMFAWLRRQPGCRSYNETSDIAFYLTPQTYLLWKLRWL